MALSKPVICYIRDDLWASFPPSLPIVSANPDTIYTQLKNLILDAKLSLFKSLEFFKVPYPEMCGRVGYHFQRKRDYQSAIFWYDLATKMIPDPSQWSFSYPAYHTWYPHIQMCVCYCRLGEYQKSYEHNEKAHAYRPKDERILYNKNLLEEKLGISHLA